MFLYFIESLMTLPLLYAIVSTIIEFKFDKKRNITIICISICANLIADGYLFLNGIDLEKIYSYAWITTCVPSFLSLFYLSKYKDGSFFFAYLTECLVASIATLMSRVLAYLLPWENAMIPVIIHTILLAIILAVCLRLFRQKLFEASRAQGKRWLLYCVMPTFSLVIWLMFSNSKTHLLNINDKVYIPYAGYVFPQDIPVLIIVLALWFFMLSLILIIIASTYKTYMERLENETLDVEVKSLQRLLSRMEEKDESLRIFRHDMRHHLSTLSALLENGKDVNRAQNYLRQLDSNLTSTKQERYCNNTVVNAILSAYAAKAQREKIEFAAEVQLPDNLTVNDLDIGAVISNSLENAYLACMNLSKEEKRFINIRFIKKKKQYVLDISNSFRGSVDFDSNGKPISKKKDHGVGTQSIQAFARKYASSIDYSADNDVFSVRIMFVEPVII